MYAFRTTLGPVELAFTDRHGGVSAAPYDSLNLAFGGVGPGEDLRESCARNLALLLDDFAPGAALADLSQVHGNAVAVAAPGSPRPQADALVSDRPDLVLLVRAADCVPIVLADPDEGVIAVTHAGREGVVSEVAPATVVAMRERGAQQITAWIGPHVCGACYEVPQALQDEVVTLVPSTRSTTTWGTPALDLGAGVRAQLCELGVHVDDSAARCTLESPDLFSYRRDGAGSGRLAGVVRLRP